MEEALLENAAKLFERGAIKKGERAEDELQDTLYQQIGQLKVELEWLKKSVAVVVAATAGRQTLAGAAHVATLYHVAKALEGAGL